MYGSDASVALKAESNIMVALIVPDLVSSHGIARAHIDTIEYKYKLIWSYIYE